MTANVKLEDEILKNPSASNWLKDQIISSKERDVLDAVNDAEQLVAVLVERERSLFLSHNQRKIKA